MKETTDNNLEKDRGVITVQTFNETKHSPDLIALKHLKIRHYQETIGENDFSGIMAIKI